MPFSLKQKASIDSDRIFTFGIITLLLSLTLSLSAYYLYSHWLREVAFSFLLFALVSLIHAMQKDINTSLKSSWLSWGLVFGLLTIYISQRLQLHRFDFSVGDPSDYFLAGVCSVTYNQDIGFFLPLTATLSALGYDILGIKYAPLINVIFYASSIPLIYFFFKRLTDSMWMSFALSTFFVCTPLTIWFSKTSFSEPLWQILILIFTLNAYRIMQAKSLSWQTLSIFYAVLFLVPFLRGEAVLYFALILFLALYHLWQYKTVKSALYIILGLLILSLSIHLTLQIRGNYLLNMQFSRIIPHITEFQLMGIIYGVTIGITLFLFLLSRTTKQYSTLPFPWIIVIFSIVFKIAVAYYFSLHKQVPFENLLYLNEYGLALGNFGFPLTVLIGIGLILLYLHALKNHTLALLIVVLYTVSYVPFVMQNIQFSDVHAFFLYWNRYYFSVFMIVHLFALSLLVKALYDQLHTYIPKNIVVSSLVVACSLLVVYSSMDARIYHIVTTEAHQKGSYKLYEWLKKHVIRQPILVVMDKDVVYKQNKEHIGRNDLKYLVSRGFSIYKINAKKYQRVSASKLTPQLLHTQDLSEVRYVLCLATSPCKLENDTLIEDKKLYLPLSWRQHFGLDSNASNIHQGDVSKSVVKHLPLYATLYRVAPKLNLELGKALSFKHMTSTDSTIFKSGWEVLPDAGALSKKGKSVLSLSNIEDNPSGDYTLLLRYAVMDATKSSPKTVTFSYNGKILKQIQIYSPYTKILKIPLSKTLIHTYSGAKDFIFQTTPKGYLLLRSLTLSKTEHH